MPGRLFVCPTCGNETTFAAAFAEGDIPACCGYEMEEILPDDAGIKRRRWRRMPRSLSRRFRCPSCNASPGERCKRADGSEREASHVQRLAYAEQVMEQTRNARVARGLDAIPPPRNK